MPLLFFLLLAILIAGPLAAITFGLGRNARRWAKWGWSIFVVICIAEHGIILFYLDHQSITQDSTFRKYISKFSDYYRSGGEPAWVVQNGGGKTDFPCEYQKIAYLYDYRMCANYIRKDPQSGKTSLVLTIVKPGPYLSYVPQHLPDRILWSSVDVLYFTVDGIITKDLRKEVDKIDE
jgi:hypothetical protein